MDASNCKPAFPVPMIPCDRDGGYTEVRFQGISARDYFAAAALQGVLANEDRIIEATEIADQDVPKRHRLLAKFAYQQADAMLRERHRGADL